MANQNIAPGARIVVRDAEWMVRKVRTSTGGHALSVTGISELVKDKEAIFLDEIDKNIKVLDPVDTKLVTDPSSSYQKSLLYMESLLRQTPPTDENLYTGHKAAMDLVPYQLDPAVQALQQPRQRILIADAVGLGKTLACGILVSELIRRGRGKRRIRLPPMQAGRIMAVSLSQGKRRERRLWHADGRESGDKSPQSKEGASRLWHGLPTVPPPRPQVSRSGLLPERVRLAVPWLAGVDSIATSRRRHAWWHGRETVPQEREGDRATTVSLTCRFVPGGDTSLGTCARAACGGCRDRPAGPG